MLLTKIGITRASKLLICFCSLLIGNFYLQILMYNVIAFCRKDAKES